MTATTQSGHGRANKLRTSVLSLVQIKRGDGVDIMWPDRRLLDLIGIDLPIIQAPLAGANGSAPAI